MPPSKHKWGRNFEKMGKVRAAFLTLALHAFFCYVHTFRVSHTITEKVREHIFDRALLALSECLLKYPKMISFTISAWKIQFIFLDIFFVPFFFEKLF